MFSKDESSCTRKSNQVGFFQRVKEFQFEEMVALSFESGEHLPHTREFLLILLSKGNFKTGDDGLFLSLSTAAI